jgi:hypothetical protein
VDYQNVGDKRGANKGGSTYVSVEVDFLKDVLKDPPIRCATKFAQVCLLGRVDRDHHMIFRGDEEFMKIRNYKFGKVCSV